MPPVVQPLKGVTTESLFLYYTVIYLESIREEIHEQRNSPAFSSVYQTRIDNVVAHEIGHAGGPGDEDDDHAEGELMGEGAVQGSNFSAQSLIRFRKTPKWHRPY
jgi:hypothetical protein